MEQELATHNEQLKLLEDLEDAFDRARNGDASKGDWELIAWQLGIREHYNRSTQQELTYA